MISNFSRSFVQSFPAASGTWILNGVTVPSNFVANSLNLLSPNPLSTNGISAAYNYPTVYTDSVKMNYRKVTFQNAGAGLPFQIDITITGMTTTGMQTETIILPVFFTPVITSVNNYLYLTTITVATVANNAVPSLNCGNGDGFSQWIMHDGSPFNNYVNVTGSPTWTINGTLQKWNRSNADANGGNSGAVIYNPLAMPIAANLTSQTATTANPIAVTSAYNAVQLVVTDSGSGPVDWYFANQQLL